jgi:hypothetical protein
MLVQRYLGLQYHDVLRAENFVFDSGLEVVDYGDIGFETDRTLA